MCDTSFLKLRQGKSPSSSKYSSSLEAELTKSVRGFLPKGRALLIWAGDPSHQCIVHLCPERWLCGLRTGGSKVKSDVRQSYLGFTSPLLNYHCLE